MFHREVIFLKTDNIDKSQPTWMYSKKALQMTIRNKKGDILRDSVDIKNRILWKLNEINS